MKYSQIGLNLWKKDYEYAWLKGECNLEATKILESSGQVLLIGPPKSGKKHLAFKSKSLVLEIDLLQPESIIAEYDKAKKNGEKSIIWVAKNLNFLTKDGLSRLASLPQFKIEELSQDLLPNLLTKRLERLGFIVNENIVEYCTKRISRTFLKLDFLVNCLEKELPNKNYQISIPFIKKLDEIYELFEK